MLARKGHSQVTEIGRLISKQPALLRHLLDNYFRGGGGNGGGVDGLARARHRSLDDGGRDGQRKHERPDHACCCSHCLLVVLSCSALVNGTDQPNRRLPIQHFLLECSAQLPQSPGRADAHDDLPCCVNGLCTAARHRPCVPQR